MTARYYRCPFCGSHSSNDAKLMRHHMLKKHRMALEALLRPLEVFREVYDPEEI